MKTTKGMLFLPLALMAFLTISSIAYGELYWESLVVTGGVPGGLPRNLPKEAREQMLAQFKTRAETARYYLTFYASRAETADGIMIIEFDTMTMYQLNPVDKTYTKVNMMSEINESMVKEMTEDIGVRPTDEIKDIAGYKCRKYYMTVMGLEGEYWLSKDIRGYKQFKAISEKVLKRNPLLRKMNVVGVSAKEGFPVKWVSNVMGMTTTTTLKKIEKRSLNKNLFKVPEGYKLKEFKIPPLK